jgi:DNA-binding HxlR family transcriptional regulator
VSGDEHPLDDVNWGELASRPCPVASALDLVGDRWSMLIIRDVMNGVRRFDDLVARLGISRATLTDRLRRLTADGILVTADYDDARGRTRTEYRMSERGWDLQLVLIALREWGDKHVLGEGNEPLRLVDRTTGNGVHLELVDDETGAIVARRELRHAPGPAFDQVRSHHDQRRHRPTDQPTDRP